jgi:hypothetical protein
MTRLEERTAALIRKEGTPLCGACASELLGVAHAQMHEALSALALAEDFTYQQECGRCHKTSRADPIVGLSSHADAEERRERAS